jgi:hypothetical protein
MAEKRTLREAPASCHALPPELCLELMPTRRIATQTFRLRRELRNRGRTERQRCWISGYSYSKGVRAHSTFEREHRSARFRNCCDSHVHGSPPIAVPEDCAICLFLTLQQLALSLVVKRNPRRPIQLVKEPVHHHQQNKNREQSRRSLKSQRAFIRWLWRS